MADNNEEYRIPKLNNENYHSWQVRVKSALVQKGWWKTIDPGYDESQGTEADRTRNDKALAFLLLAVNDEFLNDIEECATAKEAWEILEDGNTNYGLLHALHLRRDLHNIKKTEDTSMINYINSVIELNRKLKKSGYALEDREIALIILMGLPPSYESLILQLEQQEENISTKEVRKRLLIEEKRVARREQDRGQEQLTSACVLKTQQKREQPTLQKDEFRNTIASNEKKSTQGNRPFFRCYSCGRPGHLARNCRNNFRNRPNWNENQERRNETNLNEKHEVHDHKKPEEARLVNSNHEYRVMCVFDDQDVSKDVWFVDCAATGHFSPHKEKFTELEEYVDKLKVGDGRIINIYGRGTVKCKLSEENGGTYICMKEVFYAPELEDNLLSVGKLTEMGYKLNFESDKLIVKDDSGFVLSAKKRGGLYRLHEEVMKVSKVAELDTELLHRRMGHMGFKKIGQIMTNVEGKHPKIDKSKDCKICIEGKMKKKPFKSSENKATEVLQLIHTDVLGPLKPISRGGNQYAVTFIDDCSRYSEVYLMKRKSEVLEKFVEYKNRVEKETGRKIKEIRSDNGSEYLNKDFTDYLHKEGIKRQLSVPYRPQQNGVAERLNQTLTNIARCLLLEAEMPKDFWAEALHTANYLRNYCPSEALAGKIPIELWSGKKASYCNFRVFGCKAWMYLDKERRDSKFDRRAIECIFIGYAEGVKGWKLWCTQENKYYISRDVHFNEEKMPMKEGNQNLERPKEEELIFNREVEATPDNTADEEESESNDEIETRKSETTTRPKRQRIRKKVCTCCDENEKCYKVKITESNKILPDPKCLQEALSSSEAEKWKRAMQREISALEENNTWILVSRPEGAHVIQSKWVFKKKTDDKGNIVEYKARLVARGFQQIPEIEFGDVFSPVVHLKSMRIILAIAAQRNWKIYHFDIASAYLNGHLEETVLMELPRTSLEEEKQNNVVCLLKKGLYGLRQGGRQWNICIDSFFKECALIQSKSEPCIYFNEERNVILGMHVDDLAVACESDELYAHEAFICHTNL